MPLIVLCGIPCSGKTRRAHQLAEFVEREHKKPVAIVNEEILLINKNEGYKDALNEKNTRSLLKAAVDRGLNKDAVIIFDSMNYIKGYRYEIYCISRSLSTPHCVVFCDTSVHQAREWNSKRSDGFKPELFEDLVKRFETPNASVRWDSPLFTIKPDMELPFGEIAVALFDRRGPRPNASTLPDSISDTNYVHELDRIAQEMCASLFALFSSAQLGETVLIPKTQKKIVVKAKVTMVELTRLRRQFQKMTSTTGTLLPNAQAIADSFAEYLVTSL